MLPHRAKASGALPLCADGEDQSSGSRLQIDMGAGGMQVDHPSFPWIAKHVGFVPLPHSSFFPRHYGEEPSSGLAEFGEIVFFNAHGKQFTAHADPSLHPGLGLGETRIPQSLLPSLRQMSSMLGATI